MEAVVLDGTDAGVLDAAAACGAPVGEEAWRSRLREALAIHRAQLLSEIPLDAADWTRHVTTAFERAEAALVGCALRLELTVRRCSPDDTAIVYDVDVATTPHEAAFLLVDAELCTCSRVEERIHACRQLMEATARLQMKVERAEERMQRVRERAAMELAQPNQASQEEPDREELAALAGQIASWSSQRATREGEARRVWQEPAPDPGPCREAHTHVGAWRAAGTLHPMSARLSVHDSQVAQKQRVEEVERERVRRVERRRRWMVRAAGAIVAVAVLALIVVMVVERRHASTEERERIARLLARRDSIVIMPAAIRVPSLFIGPGVEKHLPPRLRGQIALGAAADPRRAGPLMAELTGWLRRSDAQMAMQMEVVERAGGMDATNFVRLVTNAETGLQAPRSHMAMGLTPRFRQVLGDYFGWVEVRVYDKTTGEPLPVAGQWILLERRRYCDGVNPIEVRFLVKAVADTHVYTMESAGPTLALLCD